MALRSTDILTGISKFLLNRAKKNGYKKQSFLVPNGVDVKIFSEEISEAVKSELKNKLGGLIDPDLTDAGNSKRQELSDALTSMGFARSDVQDVLKKSMDEEGSLEENLKKALKLLGRK
jgi:Holliday junction resolvasome RuvABC DNA-binding subunit